MVADALEIGAALENVVHAQLARRLVAAEEIEHAAGLVRPTGMTIEASSPIAGTAGSMKART